MNEHLALLLSPLYDRRPGEARSCYLHPPHQADLDKSGITDATVDLQKIRDVPPSMIDEILGFTTSRKITSALLFPFPDPAGGFMDHVRMKVFPPLETKRGTTKYLQPRRSSRLYFCRSVLDQVCTGDTPLDLVEGEKKSLAMAQLGLAAVGFCGIEGWHVGGSPELLEDFDAIPLKGRNIRLVPDGDVQTNPNVHRGAQRFAQALSRRGAHVELVLLPRQVSAA